MQTFNWLHSDAANRLKRMWRSNLSWRHGTCIVIVPLLTACGCDISAPTNSTTSSCDSGTGIFSVAEAMQNPEHPCYAWLDATSGRVGKIVNASATIWSDQTATDTGLVITAMHAIAQEDILQEESLAEQLSDPLATSVVAHLWLVGSEDWAPSQYWSPMFLIFNPELSNDEVANDFYNILPRHDYVVTAIDSQQLLANQVPGDLTATAPEVYDPRGLTEGTPSYGEAAAAESVLLVGFPASGETAGKLSASVGMVLSDEEATAVVNALAETNDVEGEIAYDAEAELLVRGYARGGMSGGGAFDAEGHVVGIIVRASDEVDGVQYVRVVRMAFMVEQLRQAFHAASDDVQAATAPYLDESIIGE